MSLIAFFKQWSLPLSLLIGVIGYLLFAYVPLLQPIGEVVGPLLESLIPVVLFVLLYVTFCKIQIKEMRPRAWHFWLQTIRVSLSAFFVWLITLTSDPNLRLVLEGMFVCVICPTAAAAPVVTEKLGGSIGSLTVYAIIANVVTSIIIPLFFPMVEKSSDISFATASLMVLRNVTTVLVIPLVLALVSRRVIPRVTDRIKEFRNLGFYLWCFNLTIITGITMRNILHASLSGTVLAILLILPLFIALLQFTIGKLVGRYYGDSISAGQALGQKNTVVGIWLTLTFLNPLAAVAPGAYVLWQNMVNALQLWYKQKYGRLKW
ncbi:MAG: bile acid:sodium symporter [Prevotella sp.]|nr:bile acid:sodium symporter [Prevotella sp.]